MKLPHKILSEVIRFKSKSPSGYTIVGYIAYFHDGINKVSAEVFGKTRKESIENLKQANL